MVKEEQLKHEIEEYLFKDYCCEFKEECKNGTRIRCAEYEAKLYLILRFAVQREEKVKELEQELAVGKDMLQEETNLHLHAEEYIKSLEEELTKKADTNHSLVEQIADLESENAELKKENAELKGIKDVATLIKANNDTVVTLMQLNNILRHTLTL